MLHAQQTIGLFSNTVDSYDGYTLFAPMSNTTTYLIDNCGEQVHSWNSTYRPSLSAYILEDGTLLRCGNTLNSAFNAGGSGGIIEMIDWNGTVIWDYTISSTTECHHHDIEYLPNGNILAIAWDSKTSAEATQAGRTTSGSTLWSEKIVEIQPDLINGGGTIVWEWKVWDHLVQDADNTKDNYGTVSTSPELIDLNFVSGSPTSTDWLHVNSIDYNADFDQIILSSHSFSEIWIVDHSTTTAEAASHSGGTYNKGGDLLYRWGNPRTYDQGTVGDQQLFNQHDANWIENPLTDGGMIMVFNNQVGDTSDYSEVNIIDPPVDLNGNYSYSGSAYSPSNFHWTYQAAVPEDFYARNISGAHRLPNGNTLVCEGTSGRFFEVDYSGNSVWEYINPVSNSGPMTQGSTATQNIVFRCTRYAPDYSGFTGKSLTPQGYIESGSTFSCTLFPETSSNQTYPIADTDVLDCYDNSSVITCPTPGTAFYGQDANFSGNQPSYSDNGNGTITDNVTGLMWQQDMGIKISYSDGMIKADTMTLGGHTDWRVPTIKELYSLILFSGRVFGSQPMDLFIDTDYFNQPLGDTTIGERLIDAQTWSSTQYVGLTMNGDSTVFGVNFIDGRIKGYPKYQPPAGVIPRTMYIRMVRGNTSYGINSFVDNSDGTITDNATGLMWQQADDGTSRDWENALSYSDSLTLAGNSDWRLPNAKELQSIVDYTRCPDVTNSPAIDPLFSTTSINDPDGNPGQYPYFWTGTVHQDGPNPYNSAVYIAFGEAQGEIGGNLLDVHGAGSQRSDPKTGNPIDYPQYNGPQGDVQYVFNYVRCVRDVEVSTDVCSAPDSIETDRITPTSARLNWQADTAASGFQVRGRALGAANWVYLTIPGSDSHKDVFGLSNNVSIEWQIRKFCNGGADTSAWSVMDTFTTGCKRPATSWVDPVTANAARLNWANVTGAAGYEIRGQRTGTGSWVNIVVGGGNTVSKDVFGLIPNTLYRWRVRTWCDQAGVYKSNYTVMDSFTTASGSRLASTIDPFDGGAELTELIIYPNPFSESTMILFDNPDNEEYQLVVKDISGRVVRDETITGDQILFNRNHLTSGIYFIELTGQRLFNGKMVIR